MVFADIAAEDGHGSRADAQGEESLSHCSEERLAETIGEKCLEIRLQVKFQALGGAGQRDGTDDQHDQRDEQKGHHRLGDFLHSVLQSPAANEHAEQHDEDHPSAECGRTCDHFPKSGRYLLRVLAGKSAHEHFDEVMAHPAGDGGIKHHQQIVGNHRNVSKGLPARLVRAKN